MMTDEERAREIAEEWISDPQVAAYATLAFQRAFAATRANQREKDAGIAEAEMCEHHPAAEIDIGYDMACQHIAAAIRKGGEA